MRSIHLMRMPWVIMIAGQMMALGRIHTGQTVTVLASDTKLIVDD